MGDTVKKWIERARYDLDTAKAMLKSRRYLYVAFMCQQALEKIMKAKIIAEGGEILRTHNLTRLAEVSKVYALMKDEYRDFLSDLTPFAIESRYGDYRDKLSEIIDHKTAVEYLRETEEIFKWLIKRIKK